MSRLQASTDASIDEGWSPEDPRIWRGERSPGDGLIPCGFCNLGGWDAPWPPEPPVDLPEGQER